MQSSDIIQPTAIQAPFAVNGDKNIPNYNATGTETSSLNLGFLPITSQALDDDGQAPERPDFNGMFYLSTDLRVFLQDGGFITYRDDVASEIGGYPKGAILGFKNANGFGFVESLKENNQNTNFNTNPSYIDGTNWKYLHLLNVDADITAVNNAINTLSNQCVKLTGNQAVAGNKTFSGTTSLAATNISGTTSVTGTANFTGATSVPTVAYTTNSTRAASTAFVRNFTNNYIKANWTHTSEATQGSSTAVGTYTISLTSYLPQTNTNDYYEIYIHAYMSDNSSTKKYCRIFSSTFGTSTNTGISACQLVTGDYADISVNDFILPVKANGQIKYIITGGTVDSLIIRFLGYKKLVTLA